MLPKAAGLSISPLVGQNGFPHVTGGSGALAPELRFDTPGPAYAGPDFITVWHQLCYDICREIVCKNDAGRSFKLPKNPQYVVCFDMQFVFGGCYRAEIFLSFLFVVVFVTI